MIEVDYNARCIFVDKFDYTPWQRVDRHSKTELNQARLKQRHRDSPDHDSLVPRQQSNKTLVNKRSASSLTSLTSPTRSPEKNIEPVFGKECSSLCRHGKPNALPVEITKKEKRISKDGSITLLKIQIKEKKRLLDEFRGKYMKLIRENVALKDELMSFEHLAHGDAKTLLEKYKKFKDALAFIDVEHKKIYEKEIHVYEKTKSRIKSALAASYKDIEKLDKNIEEKKNALSVLAIYKEKELPEKSEKIKYLEEEIRKLAEVSVDDITELEDIVSLESCNYRNHFELETEALKEDIALGAIGSLNISVKNIAQQNDAMKKEIALHEKEVAIQKDDLKALQKDIRRLKDLRSEQINRRLYPQNFMEKCAPETELDLNIPLQRWLLL